MESAPPSAEAFTIDLLDSATGQSQQSWRFSGVSRIQLGRARENDVAVSNPYVSRSHAYIEHENGHWTAIAISSQQLVSSGRRVQSIDLIPGTIFQLGPHGSSLRFAVESPDEPPSKGFDFTGTLAYDGPDQPSLKLDLDQLSQEVTAITEGDFFQALSANVNKLRQTRNGPGRTAP
ncbi:hypothetical protein AYO47_07785 [Planctomyces sp. SCGC AG-212-M04]|nr:hypothetical protein AYO47_07785 [Planctomyces sp. SCGC AG-212-M04]